MQASPRPEEQLQENARATTRTRVEHERRDLDVFATPIGYDTHREKYSFDHVEPWAGTGHRVVSAVTDGLLPSELQNEIEQAVYARQFIPGGRYLYASGREYHQVNNCFLFRAEDSREGWSELCYSSAMALMSGGGIGVDYSPVREKDALVRKTGGVATGPLSLMHIINELGRGIVNGGNRRSAIWAGLNWSHPDIKSFLTLKNHSPELRALKAQDIKFPLPMELTNISTIYDKDFFDAYDHASNPMHARAREVWETNVFQALSTAEPGFSINFRNARESLRNACTEVVSEDNNDKCNLGTLWMGRYRSIDEFAQAVRLGTIFLLCGGIYSHTPTEQIREVGSRNNRIGLGLGGIHEWLMLRGYDYEVVPELEEWLAVYKAVSEDTALQWSRILNVPMPKGLRSIAPNGTIGLVAESTTGIEPLFCAAYIRRYFKDGQWHYQYVIDGAVKRLLEAGVPLELIERNDAYALDFEQRVRFQAGVQDYVDMAISSTCNLDPWGSERNNATQVKQKSDILMKYARRLRGFTCYPDGCRDGQPLTKVSVAEAREHEGAVYLDVVRECTNGVCGL